MQKQDKSLHKEENGSTEGIWKNRVRIEENKNTDKNKQKDKNEKR